MKGTFSLILGPKRWGEHGSRACESTANKGISQAINPGR